MDTSEEDELVWALGQLEALKESVRSCQLATASASGMPLSSYAPVWIDEKGDFFVYVSAMAKHYAHLRKTGKASLSLIEDEGQAEQLFARKRVTADCEASLVERGSEDWNLKMAGLESRHGATVGYLKDMLDFDLFRLRPSEGRLVLGFGKSYRVFGYGLSEVAHLGTGGHRSRK